MACEKCEELKKHLRSMEDAVERTRRNMGWKIPVYALVALRELETLVKIAKEKLEKKE